MADEHDDRLRDETEQQDDVRGHMVQPRGHVGALGQDGDGEHAQHAADRQGEYPQGQPARGPAYERPFGGRYG